MSEFRQDPPYTIPAGQPRRKGPVSFTKFGNVARLSFEFDAAQCECLTDLLVPAAELCQEAVNDHVREQHARSAAQLEAHERHHKAIGEFRRLGLRAARIKRRELAYGLKHRDALAIAAKHLETDVPTVTLAVAMHEKRLKSRVQRFKDRALVRLAGQGLSNREVAKRLGVTPSYAGKLVRIAIDRVATKT